MDRTKPPARWSAIREDVRKRWRKLTDEELDAAQGSLEQLSQVIQEKYGEPRQAIDIQLKHLLEQKDHAGKLQ